MSDGRSDEAAWTVLSLLQTTAEYLHGKGIDSARLDAEVLLAGVLGLPRIQLYARHDRPVSPGELNAYREQIRRRARGEPVARIRGEKEFYSLSFRVTGDVLVPRPETEGLVDEAIAWLRRESGPAAPRILDIGTGSGCIAVALAKQCPGASVVATDTSRAALAVAHQNAGVHGVSEKIVFREGDLYAALTKDDIETPFDIVVSNPPYIDRGEELPREVADFDPPEALYAEEAGTALYRRLAQGLDRVLHPQGLALVELGAGQAEAAAAFFGEAGFEHCEAIRDLNGIERILRIIRIGEDAQTPGELVYEPIPEPAPPQESARPAEAEPASSRDSLPPAADPRQAAAYEEALNRMLDAYAEGDGDEPDQPEEGDPPDL